MFSLRWSHVLSGLVLCFYRGNQKCRLIVAWRKPFVQLRKFYAAEEL